MATLPEDMQLHLTAAGRELIARAASGESLILDAVAVGTSVTAAESDSVSAIPDQVWKGAPAAIDVARVDASGAADVAGESTRVNVQILVPSTSAGDAVFNAGFTIQQAAIFARGVVQGVEGSYLFAAARTPSLSKAAASSGANTAVDIRLAFVVQGTTLAVDVLLDDSSKASVELATRAATTLQRGQIQLATAHEVSAKQDSTKAVTPTTLANYVQGEIGHFAFHTDYVLVNESVSYLGDLSGAGGGGVEITGVNQLAYYNAGSVDLGLSPFSWRLSSALASTSSLSQFLAENFAAVGEASRVVLLDREGTVVVDVLLRLESEDDTAGHLVSTFSTLGFFGGSPFVDEPPLAVNFGTPRLQPASHEDAGLVQLATAAEVSEGSDDGKAITPAGLAALQASATQRGLIALASEDEVLAASAVSKAVPPHLLPSSFEARPLPSGAATASGGAFHFEDTFAWTPGRYRAAENFVLEGHAALDGQAGLESGELRIVHSAPFSFQYFQAESGASYLRVGDDSLRFSGVWQRTDVQPLLTARPLSLFTLADGQLASVQAGLTPQVTQGAQASSSSKSQCRSEITLASGASFFVQGNSLSGQYQPELIRTADGSSWLVVMYDAEDGLWYRPHGYYVLFDG